MLRVVVLTALVLSFVLLVATHLFIGVRMLLRVKPRYRGLLALVIPPLAPLWAYKQRWRHLCWLWVGAVAVYAAAVGLASI